jgi:hypothetical protein
MLTLSETAAAAADATAARLRVAEATLRALALRRPAVRWVIEGLTARGIAPDGTTGRPVPLFRDDEPDVPAPVDLERDARYATEPQPPWADPTRVCGCGASAWISARLLAGPDAERLLQRDPADAPMIVSVFRNGETPVAVRMATVVCERHVCVLSQRDVQVLGLTPAELTRRLEADREREWFRYESMTLADPSGARGVVVWGRNVASAFFHDDLLSGLHAALARPLGDATRATAIASTPGSLVLGDPMLEPEVIERLVSNGALREGLAAGTETPFRLTRTIDLTASPCGRWSARTADHGSSPGE